jgi:hypothetical protein
MGKIVRLKPHGAFRREAITARGIARLTIDTDTDSYEQAIAAVQAAYGLQPVVPDTWPPAPAPGPRPDPRDLGSDDLGDGWTDQLLFRMVAALTPGARAVLRRITELGGTATYDEVQQCFATHPTTLIPLSRIGGTLTSFHAVQRRNGPAGAALLLQRDEQARIYRINPALVDGLNRVFPLADTRPELLRREPARPAT